MSSKFRLRGDRQSHIAVRPGLEVDDPLACDPPRGTCRYAVHASVGIGSSNPFRSKKECYYGLRCGKSDVGKRMLRTMGDQANVNVVNVHIASKYASSIERSRKSPNNFE